MKIATRAELTARRAQAQAWLAAEDRVILVCAGTGCIAGGSMKVYEKLTALCAECGLKMRVALREEGGHDTLHFKRSGCRGYTAIAKAEEAGLLGDDILGSGFSFHLHINRGAGANGSARSARRRVPARRRSR